MPSASENDIFQVNNPPEKQHVWNASSVPLPSKSPKPTKDKDTGSEETRSTFGRDVAPSDTIQPGGAFRRAPDRTKSRAPTTTTTTAAATAKGTRVRRARTSRTASAMPAAFR